MGYCYFLVYTLDRTYIHIMFNLVQQVTHGW